jgi:ribosomal protein S18 acetylase RimI-like enzyme
MIAAYYTFSAAEIRADELFEEEKRRLPKYSAFPAAIIGRLAVDRDFQGRGLGAAMIYDAARRADRADPAIFALVVDAKDGNAAAFYRRMDFQPFASNPLALYLPIAKRP